MKAPVKILGFGQGQTSYDVPLRPVLTETMAKASAQTAFKMAGLSPKDIDVAQIYDCYTIAVMMTLEDYGFCKKGEGGKWVEGGRVAAGGELPINTSGGLLSETGMPGLQLVMEGVRQMRGTSVNQVKDAATCVVSNQGGIMTHALDLDPGSLTMSFPLPEPTPLSQPYWDALRAGTPHVPALPQVRARLAAGARRVPEVPRRRVGLDRSVRQGPRDQLGDLSPRLSRGVQGRSSPTTSRWSSSTKGRA